jgi:hypothetical protein
MIRLLFAIGFISVAACTPTPTALPEDFSADFDF